MKKKFKIIFTIISFLIVMILVLNNYVVDKNNRNNFKILNDKISNYENTTGSRVAKAMITLPDGATMVSLVDNIGHYETSPNTRNGVVTIQNQFLKTKFISGIYQKKNPRLDAIVPMYVNYDSHGGSTYIVLFNDKGDATVEKSYARLGGADVKIQNINIIPMIYNTVDDVEYKVDAIYKLEGTSQKTGKYVSIPREVIIPVIDGHFDPKNTISK